VVDVAAGDPDVALIADLVTASHILENEGVLDSFGHVSVRSARNPNRFYIPRAMAPGLVTVADIVEVDAQECKPVAADAPRLNGERFIHSEIYKAHTDVGSVIHSHSRAVIPFGVAGVPLRPVVVQAGFLPPVTPLFEVREATGPVAKRGMMVVNPKLGAFLAKKLGDAPVILMRGHGNTVVGATVKQATVRAAYTDINALMQYQALMLNPEITAMDDAELLQNATENFDVDRPWENFRRRLEMKKG
jgi:ribulose-5-phosphate 4-epimerase/fuculose-1-phosphate aldolase